jgi:hypothetical protein
MTLTTSNRPPPIETDLDVTCRCGHRRFQHYKGRGICQVPDHTSTGEYCRCAKFAKKEGR